MQEQARQAKDMLREAAILHPLLFLDDIPAEAYAIKLSDGIDVYKYAYTETGLLAAHTDASSGDVIELPDSGTLTLTSPIVIPAGVGWKGGSRWGCVIVGDEISGGAGSWIENLSVVRTANDGATLKGIVMAVSGTFKILNCDVLVTQSGAGDARALSCEANSSIIEMWGTTFVNGQSSGGNGYGAWRDTGNTTTIHQWSGRALGSTTPAVE